MMGGFSGWMMMLFMVLFWVVIVGLAVWLLSALFPRPPAHDDGHHAHRSDSVSEILKQRYARGELTREEYEQMRQDLEA